MYFWGATTSLKSDQFGVRKCRKLMSRCAREDNHKVVSPLEGFRLAQGGPKETRAAKKKSADFPICSGAVKMADLSTEWYNFMFGNFPSVAITLGAL